MKSRFDRSQTARRAFPIRIVATALATMLLVASSLILTQPNAAAATDESESPVSSSSDYVILEPGSTYNVAEAKYDTLIAINQSGTYTLEGQTNQAYVRIIADPGKEITVLLEDGLKITPNNLGTRAPAIEVFVFYDELRQSKVSLLTKPNAEVTLSGYKQSSGISAELVSYAPSATSPPKPDEPLFILGTQDPQNPGTLAVDSGLFSGIGISSVGNGFISVTGGTVKPKGTGNFPAIAASNLMVSGGSIVAETAGDSTPAIMGINKNASLNMVVSDGRVEASAPNSTAPAIGSIDGDATVAVSGGTVYASRRADAPVIGSVNGNATITISGGFVRARDATNSLVVGSTNGNATVRITGGTLDSNLSACGSDRGSANVVISGGSFTGFVKGTKGTSMITAVNESGAVVYRVPVCLEGSNAAWLAPKWNVEGVSYGTNDITLLKLNQYQWSCTVLWIPANAEITGAVDEYGNRYEGEIHPTSMTSSLDYGILNLAANVDLLLTENYDGYDGSARVSYGSSEIEDVDKVEFNEPGYSLQGFFDEPSDGTMVINSDYQLATEDSKWVNNEGKWARTDAPYTLYARLAPQKYTVTFDANGGSVSGQEPKTQQMTFDQSCALTSLANLGITAPNGAVLAGWLDTTTGKLYDDQAQVINLCSANSDGTLSGHTLQAQWAAKSGSVELVITQDGEPVDLTSPKTDIKLIGNDPSQPVTGFVRSDNGTYTLDDVPAGTYGIDIDAQDDEGQHLYPTGNLTVTVNQDDAAVLHIEYYSVSVEAGEEGATAWLSNPGVTNQIVLKGTKVTIGAGADEESGKVFDGWSYWGVKPAEWDSGAMNETMNITINGPLIATAHTRSAVYTVKFDANGGNGDQITMENQDMVYDEPQNLLPNVFTRTGYAFTGWNTKADGSGTPYTDGQSVANLSAVDDDTVTLYAQWKPITYRISFDANTPGTASTQVTGDTADQVLTYDKANPIAQCGYTLPGYTFDGWSTMPDGSGTRYQPGGPASNLASQDGAVVTLYAQWKPQTYTVTFLPGEGGGSPASRSMTFDQSCALASLGSLGITAPQGKTFLGWSTGTLGSLYADEAEVVNLCTLDESGATQGMTLTASWTDATGAVIVIYENGALCTRFADNDIELRQNGSSNKGATRLSDGVFAFGSDLPEGSFEIWIDGKNTGKTVDKGSITTVDYCSVKIASDAGGTAWLVDPETKEKTDSLDCALADTEIQIGASANEGYRFKTYAASGTEPTWESDLAQPNQTITVKGQATITAQWEPIKYTVAFDANKPDGASDSVSGAMSGQTMLYDQACALPLCQYALRGYAFTGWNTEADGSGGAYADCGEIENLTATDGGTVTLHAQWEPITYTVSFNANVPAGASTADDLTGGIGSIDCTFGKGETLPANTFALPGYEFTGWNTEADGTGVSLNDKDSTDKAVEGGGNGQAVTLYAQWKPRTYTITFDANSSEGGSGAMGGQTLAFDESEALNSCTFTSGDKSFIGWSIVGETGTYRILSDGERVVNLCTLDDSGTPIGYTLQAQWASDNGVIAVVTKDNVPVTDATVYLYAEGGGSSPMQEDERPGVYRLDNIDQGQYRIGVNDYPNSNSFQIGGSSTRTVFVDYSTITAASTDHATAQLKISEESCASKVVFTTDPATISASVDEGYVFDGYTVSGVMPDNLDPSNPAEQRITVQGQVTLTANARPITYTVAFDANGGSGSMGSQSFAYDKPQSLSPNTFTRAGYAFAGWNTMPDGSGDPYANGQEVVNLSNRDGTTVMLYAQWEPVPPPTSYETSVAVHAHGKASVDPAHAIAGEKVALTVCPDEGFEIRSVAAVDAQGRTVELAPQADGTFTFTMPAADVSVAIVLGCDGGNLCPSRNFSDADPSQWYHDALDWAIVHGVLNGFDNTGLMEPDTSITRAQMAQVLWNAEGRPAASAPVAFSDVSADDWFASAVAWASSAGIFEGYAGTGLFGPNDVLTREQAAAVMMRWAELRGHDASVRADLSSYPDADKVSDWAVEYLSWAVATGIVKGVEMPEGVLALEPQGESSRAQVATLMMRLLCADPLDPFA